MFGTKIHICFWRQLSFLLMFIALAACGGGGGGGGSSGIVADQTVNAGEVVTLSAAGVNVDGLSVRPAVVESYAWAQTSGTAVVIENANNVIATFVAPSSAIDNRLTFTVTITGDTGNTVTDTRVIDIRRGLVVSGRITPSSGSRVDSDVNDPASTYAPNDEFSTAQALPNPVVLGGYVSVTGTGNTGDRFASAGDNKDYFYLQLAPGQVINLTLGENQSDLNLCLYDENEMMLECSEGGIGIDEGLTVPTNFTGAKDFYIEVSAAAGNSSYVLTVGVAPLLASVDGLRTSNDFVPGEVIVKFKDNVMPAGVLSDSMSMRASSVGLQAAAGAPGRSMLMRIGDDYQFAQAQKMLGMKSKSARMSPKMKKKMDTLLTVKALSQRADVEYARPNFIYKPLATPDDPLYAAQWHYPLMNLPQAWEVAKGDGVIVAVIDTGVLLGHPDLSNKLVAGYDFIRDDTVAADDDPGIDANPDDPGDQGYGFASTFHGTHVAGTIGAETNNNTGVAGVGWNVSIMPLRTLGVGGGNSYDIEQAVRFAAGLANDSNTVPARRADVINLSLGGTGGDVTDPAVYAAYTAARDAGVIIIAAAGNDSSNVPFYPASYPGVVSVSAVDQNKELTFYSNFGSGVDVTAPGGDSSQNINGDSYPDGVMSTLGSDVNGGPVFTYGISQGTSMASPHVAGVVALMKSVYADMTPDQFDTALRSGAITEDLGVTGPDDNYGHGLLDALDAVLYAQTVLANGGDVDPNPFLTISPGSLSFNTAGLNSTISINNAGTGDLSIVSINEDSEGWLSVTAIDVDATSKLGEYTVSVDRDGLDPGTYTATITVVSSENTVTIPVIMQVVSMAIYDDVGFQYILIYDPATDEVIDQKVAAPFNGSYTFNFSAIPPGNYQIFAGTDIDNDGFICDSGESCGFYPDSNSPDQGTFALTDTDILNADFVSGFTSGLNGNTLGVQLITTPETAAADKQISGVSQ